VTGPFRFYLGVHRAAWLALASVPLFVTRAAFGALRSLPRARTAWALDSGGFTELSRHGLWRTTAREYEAANLEAESMERAS
jgi:hypothetical protein